MRGQATSIDMSSEEVRNTKIPEARKPRSFDGSTTNNKHALSNKLPTYLQPLHCVGSARPSTALTGLGSDVSSNLSITINTWKPPDISSLHNVIRTGIRLDKPMQTFISLLGYSVFHQVNGGAYRDRTDDPLLAKQVLSQLS